MRSAALRFAIGGLVLAGAALAAAPAAQAAFPGANGKIAGSSGFGTGLGIYTVKQDGTDRTLISPQSNATSGPRWSPDGQRIAYSTTYNTPYGAIHIMNADGSGNFDTGIHGRHPSWSPSGTRLVYETIDQVLVASDLDGSNAVQLTPSGLFRNVYDPVWSPDGTKIAFSAVGACGFADIATVNPDGTGVTVLTTRPDPCALDFGHPDWSPDSQTIIFSETRWSPYPDHADPFLSMMNRDGSGLHQIRSSLVLNDAPVWSPDGELIRSQGHTYRPDGTAATGSDNANPSDWQPLAPTGANIETTITDSSDPSPEETPITYLVRVTNLNGTETATGVTATNDLASSFTPVDVTPSQGSCTSSGGHTSCSLGSLAQGASATITVRAIAPAAAGTMTADTASASATESDPDPINNSDSETTLVSAYPRPRGATPLRVPLVPASSGCTAPNNQHGSPLSFGSCAPPSAISPNLTVGTPDANGARANSVGSILFKVLSGDFRITATMSDVRSKQTLADYTGELDARTVVRLTDSSIGSDGKPSGTVSDWTFRMPVRCTATSDASVGSTCASTTTANAITPGMVVSVKRAVWQLGQVQLFDGGADGSFSTDDNVLFAVQGLFVP